MVKKKTSRWEYFCFFMQELHNLLTKKSNSENLIYVIDNASIHSALLLKEILLNDLNIVYLPSYSPQLNMIELIWAESKKYFGKIVVTNENNFMINLVKSF